MAKEKDINAQIILRNYMLERLLERISLSKYQTNFILKGGMLVAALVGIDTRSTMDLDATIKGYKLTEESIRKAFDEILSIQVNDGVLMKVRDIKDIREEADYTGLRLTIDTTFDGIKIPIKVDVTTGDKITPKEISYSFNLLFEERKIHILAYTLETVLAEKIETVISRNISNTRMRDFYDIYILQKIYGGTIDKELLSKAIKATSEARNSSVLFSNLDLDMNRIKNDETLKNLWERYRNEYNYASDITWNDVINAVQNLLEEVDIN